MKCHCGKTALRRVGDRGFCKDHYAEVCELAKYENQHIESERSISEYLPDDHFERQKRERAKENGWR